MDCEGKGEISSDTIIVEASSNSIIEKRMNICVSEPFSLNEDHELHISHSNMEDGAKNFLLNESTVKETKQVLSQPNVINEEVRPITVEKPDQQTSVANIAGVDKSENYILYANPSCEIGSILDKKCSLKSNKFSDIKKQFDNNQPNQQVGTLKSNKRTNSSVGNEELQNLVKSHNLNPKLIEHSVNEDDSSIKETKNISINSSNERIQLFDIDKSSNNLLRNTVITPKELISDSVKKVFSESFPQSDKTPSFGKKSSKDDVEFTKSKQGHYDKEIKSNDSMPGLWTNKKGREIRLHPKQSCLFEEENCQSQTDVDLTDKSQKDELKKELTKHTLANTMDLKLSKSKQGKLTNEVKSNNLILESCTNKTKEELVHQEKLGITLVEVNLNSNIQECEDVIENKNGKIQKEATNINLAELVDTEISKTKLGNSDNENKSTISLPEPCTKEEGEKHPNPKLGIPVKEISISNIRSNNKTEKTQKDELQMELIQRTLSKLICGKIYQSKEKWNNEVALENSIQESCTNKREGKKVLQSKPDRRKNSTSKIQPGKHLINKNKEVEDQKEVTKLTFTKLVDEISQSKQGNTHNEIKPKNLLPEPCTKEEGEKLPNPKLGIPVKEISISNIRSNNNLTEKTQKDELQRELIQRTLSKLICGKIFQSKEKWNNEVALENSIQESCANKGEGKNVLQSKPGGGTNSKSKIQQSKHVNKNKQLEGQKELPNLNFAKLVDEDISKSKKGNTDNEIKPSNLLSESCAIEKEEGRLVHSKLGISVEEICKNKIKLHTNLIGENQNGEFQRELIKRTSSKVMCGKMFQSKQGKWNDEVTSENSILESCTKKIEEELVLQAKLGIPDREENSQSNVQLNEPFKEKKKKELITHTTHCSLKSKQGKLYKVECLTKKTHIPRKSKTRAKTVIPSYYNKIYRKNIKIYKPCEGVEELKKEFSIQKEDTKKENNTKIENRSNKLNISNEKCCETDSKAFVGRQSEKFNTSPISSKFLQISPISDQFKYKGQIMKNPRVCLVDCRKIGLLVSNTQNTRIGKQNQKPEHETCIPKIIDSIKMADSVKYSPYKAVSLLPKEKVAIKRNTQVNEIVSIKYEHNYNRECSTFSLSPADVLDTSKDCHFGSSKTPTFENPQVLTYLGVNRKQVCFSPSLMQEEIRVEKDQEIDEVSTNYKLVEGPELNEIISINEDHNYGQMFTSSLLPAGNTGIANDCQFHSSKTPLIENTQSSKCLRINRTHKRSFYTSSTQEETKVKKYKEIDEVATIDETNHPFKKCKNYKICKKCKIEKSQKGFSDSFQAQNFEESVQSHGDQLKLVPTPSNCVQKHNELIVTKINDLSFNTSSKDNQPMSCHFGEPSLLHQKIPIALGSKKYYFTPLFVLNEEKVTKSATQLENTWSLTHGHSTENDQTSKSAIKQDQNSCKPSDDKVAHSEIVIGSKTNLTTLPIKPFPLKPLLMQPLSIQLDSKVDLKNKDSVISVTNEKILNKWFTLSTSECISKNIKPSITSKETDNQAKFSRKMTENEKDSSIQSVIESGHFIPPKRTKYETPMVSNYICSKEDSTNRLSQSRSLLKSHASREIDSNDSLHSNEISVLSKKANMDLDGSTFPQRRKIQEHNKQSKPNDTGVKDSGINYESECERGLLTSIPQNKAQSVTIFNPSSLKKLNQGEEMSDSLSTNMNKQTINCLKNGNNQTVTKSEVDLKKLKKRIKSKEEEIEESLDGCPPFIREVFKCENLRDGFNSRDLIFVLSLLPDIEEMTSTQRVIFQTRVIKIINNIFTK